MEQEITMHSISQSRKMEEQRQRAVPRAPFHVTPLSVSKARGAEVWDVDGNRYIDFAGGIGTLNAGHCPESVVKAIREQSGCYLHTCFNVMMYAPYIRLAEKINSLVPGPSEKKTMFFNSGAEAVENAIKIARAATGREAVICFDHAFHGRTLLTMTLTAKEKPYKQGFGPFAPEIYRAEYPYPYRLPAAFADPEDAQTYIDYFDTFFREKVAAEKVAAVIIEPVLGEGGFIVPPRVFLPTLKAICEKHGILFIADEIQTGFCRTGKMFAIEHYGIEPDLIVLGKSLASGMPLSAVCGKSALMEAPQVGALGGTYSGNPVACAAALATIDIYEKEKLHRRAEEIGHSLTAFWRRQQQQYEVIGDVRALGAMVGVEFVTSSATREPNPELVARIVKEGYKRGLILMSAGTYGNVLRALMPLVISDAQMEEAMSILSDILSEVL